MRVKDVSVTATELFLRALFDRLELAARESDGSTKATALTFEIRFGNLGAIDLARAFLKTQHTPDHDTVRNAETSAAQLADRTRDLFAFVLLKLVEVSRE